MAILINLNDARKKLYELEGSAEYNKGVTDAFNALFDLPAVNAEPIKHGRWIKRGENLYECSKCGAWVTPSEYIPLELHKFCRGCRAKMDEAEGSYTIDAELVGALLKDEVEE